MTISGLGSAQGYQNLASSGATTVNKTGDGDTDDTTKKAAAAQNGAASKIMQQLGIGSKVDIRG